MQRKKNKKIYQVESFKKTSICDVGSCGYSAAGSIKSYTCSMKALYGIDKDVEEQWSQKQIPGGHHLHLSPLGHRAVDHNPANK